MGYRIKTSDITSSAAMPIKSGTLDLINNEFDFLSDQLVQGLIGRDLGTEVWVLYGCYPTISGSSYSFTAGAVYYNNQIYAVPSTSFTLSGGQVPILQINTASITATNADPVLFSDGNTYNVHLYKTVNIVAGASGGGIANYSDVKYYNTDWQTIGGSRWSNAFVRIHNGMLEFKGYSYWSVNPSGSFGSVLLTFPSIWNRSGGQIATRRCFVSYPGSGATNTPTYEDYITVRLDTNFIIMSGSANMSSSSYFSTDGVKFDLTCLNGIPAYW